MRRGAMKKGLIGAGAVLLVVVVIGYLAGIAYSRHLFMERLDETLVKISVESGVAVSKQQVSSGFFSTSMRLVAHLDRFDIGGERSELVVPFTARHGIFSTRLDGQLDLEHVAGDAREALFADLLSPGRSAEFTASVSHLSERLKSELRLPQIDRAGDDRLPAMTLHAGVLRLDGVEGDFDLSGEWQSASFITPDAQLQFGPLRFVSRYAGEEGNFHQGDELTLDRAQIQGARSLPVTLERINYHGQTSFAADNLRYTLALSVGDASVYQQRLGSARLSATLDNLDGAASQRLLKGLEQGLSSRRSAAEPLTDWTALVEPHWSDLLTVLAGSPQLTVDELELETSMLEKPIHVEGALNFDGRDIAGLEPDALRAEDGWRPLLSRLYGDFDLDNAPPLVSLIAGVAPDQSSLNITLDNGTLSINEQPWFKLF